MVYDDLALNWPCGEPPDVNELHALMAVVRLSGGDGMCTVPADVLTALQATCVQSSNVVYSGQARAMFTTLVPATAAWRGVLATGQMQWLTSINGDGVATFFPCVRVDDEDVDDATQRVTWVMNFMLEMTFTKLRTKIPGWVKHVRTHIEHRMCALLPMIATTLDTEHHRRRYVPSSDLFVYWVTCGLPPQCTYNFTQTGPTLW